LHNDSFFPPAFHDSVFFALKYENKLRVIRRKIAGVDANLICLPPAADTMTS
jgi:hypothetical protein